MCEWSLLIEDYENVGNNLYYTTCNNLVLSNFQTEKVCPHCYKKVIYKGGLNGNK